VSLYGWNRLGSRLSSVSSYCLRWTWLYYLICGIWSSW